MKPSEQALYITLIDFLIQIIFVGLVVSVLYVVAQSNNEEKTIDHQKKVEELTKNIEKAAKESGMTVTELMDYLTRLGPVQTLGPAESASGRIKLAKELEESVSKVGGVEEAKKILDKSGGQGYESCLPNKMVIVTFHAFDNRIEVEGETKEFKALLSQIGLATSKIDKMTFAEFQSNFNKVIIEHPQCRYNVNIVEHSNFKKPRDVIRKFFWAKNIRDAS